MPNDPIECAHCGCRDLRPDGSPFAGLWGGLVQRCRCRHCNRIVRRPVPEPAEMMPMGIKTGPMDPKLTTIVVKNTPSSHQPKPAKPSRRRRPKSCDTSTATDHI